MFFDAQNQLQSNAPATGVSTDVYDKVGLTQDPTIGEEIVGLVVPTTITTPGTLLVEMIQSTTSAMAAPDVVASRSFLAADLTIDKFLTIPFPQGSVSKQYLAFRFSGTAVLNVNAHIVCSDEVPVNKFFPKIPTTSL